MRARARVPSEQAPLCLAAGPAGGGRYACAAPCVPDKHSPCATRPSSLPLPLPALRPTACELLRRCRLPGLRCALRACAYLPGAASRCLSRRAAPPPGPSTPCQPRGHRCPCRDRGKFTNTNPGPVSPEALLPPPRPLR